MKYIKVITEVRKENFEKELANYMSQGIAKSLSMANHSIYNSIVYYALLIKETPE